MVGAWCVPVLLLSCTMANSRPDPPTFVGVETDWWLVQESEAGGRRDLLPAFEESARSYGCSTERLGSKTSFNILGERRSYSGISASCYEGTIALITLVDGHVRIGCQKPTTREACDTLLRNISEAR